TAAGLYLPQNYDHAWKGFNLLPDYGSDGGAKSYILASIVGIATISALLAVIFIPILRRRKVNSNLPVAAKSDLQPGSVPAWMMQDDLAAATQQNCSRFAPKPDFAEKTVESLAKAAHRALVTEPSAKVDGFLQSIDSRIKLVATLLLVLAITFTRHLIAPTIILVACCALAFSSRIDLRTLFARVVPFALFFGSVIAVPAMLDVVTPGPKILHIWFTSMYITSTGLITALTLIIRLMAALCAVQLFTLSTPRQEIFRSIRSIGIPTAFTMTLEMTYRYLEVFARTATEGFTARKSRLTGADSLGQSHVFLGDLGGALFGKSLNFATEVHSAMVSRGWDGSVVIANPRTIGRRDIVLIFGGLALCTAILVVDRYFH
ncbi:MAG: cobalt ECF transporter T component CbiQ, partial [Chthonomonadales bacterium]